MKMIWDAKGSSSPAAWAYSMATPALLSIIAQVQFTVASVPYSICALTGLELPEVASANSVSLAPKVIFALFLTPIVPMARFPAAMLTRAMLQDVPVAPLHPPLSDRGVVVWCPVTSAMIQDLRPAVFVAYAAFISPVPGLAPS